MGVASIALILVVQVAWTACACNFPSFMQNTTDRDWRGRIKEQFTQFTLEVVVSGHTLSVHSTDATTKPYTRFCVQPKDDDKYMVAHEEAGQMGNRYTCMQFVKRSQNIVQLKVGPLSEQMDASLCDEANMHLDDWILIDRNHIAEDRQMCPLRGGFSTVIYDRVRSRGICDSYQGHTRLESECVNGEGLLFHFRHVKCVPEHVYMRAEQRTMCLAHWQQGLYTFMLIKHDTLSYIWMFRYQTFYGDQRQGDSFVALLINDLVAEMGSQLTQTRSYVRLSCARDQPVLVTSLCVDDYEICAHRREPCPQGDRDQMALTCPRSCGVCNASRPLVCQMPTRLQGQWRESTHAGVVSLTVNSSSLVVHGYMDETFHCIQWDVPSHDSRDGFTSQQMLVTDYRNGCKPRYTCTRVLQSGDNTLFFGISQSLRWPFTESVQDPIDCRGFEYTQDTTLYPNPFRGKHTKLLFSAGSQNPVPCGLPPDMHSFTVSLKDDTECTGAITENPDGTSLALTLSGCPGNAVLQDMSSFVCMASSRMLSTSELLIVTRTAHNPSQSHCWIFPKRPRSTLYLVEGSHCNEETRKRIRKGRLKPLAVFTKLRRQHLVQPDVTPDDAQSRDFSRTTLPGGGGGVNAVTVADHKVLDKNNRTQPNRNHTGDAVDSEEVNATPFVVIGALLFFAAFQIPCACNSS